MLGVNQMVGMARNLYDPKYGTPASADDFTKEHADYLEDLVYTINKKRGTLHQRKVIGLVPVKYKTSLKLYWVQLSQPSRALKTFLLDSGIPHQDHELGFGEQKKPEFLAINPAGTVPFMTLDGKLMTETVALIRLLCRQHPALADRFYPSADHFKKYQIDKWCDFYTDALRPAFISELGQHLRAKMIEKRPLNDKEMHIIKKA